MLLRMKFSQRRDEGDRTLQARFGLKNAETWLVQCPHGTVLLEPRLYLKSKRERRAILGLLVLENRKKKEKKKETEIEREQVIESKIEREGAQLKQDK